ncbi:hypothetical protein CDQ83_17520 [Clostridium thermosuccinogenes]|nr:hypothetical protein CDQ83_17520 [Pseudoclostridium thermosuccinogenes]
MNNMPCDWEIYMKTTYEYIIECVSTFRKKFELGEHEPINDIFSIVDESFLILKFPNKMGVSGVSTEKKDRNKTYKCIYINTNEPIGRQNFTFAHELYHIYFKKATNALCLEDERDKDEVEKEAEMFASNLLIPRYWLLKKFKDYGLKNNRKIEMHHVFWLQREFNVSFQAIIYAIDDLGKHEIYGKFSEYIPQIPEYFKQYYNSNWDKLEKETKKFSLDLNLNSVIPVYEFPERFKKNLINNFLRGLVEFEVVEDIFNFFEKRDELEKYL